MNQSVLSKINISIQRTNYRLYKLYLSIKYLISLFTINRYLTGGFRFIQQRGIFQCLAILLQDFFFKYGNTRLAEKVYHSFNEDKPYFMKNTNKSMVPYSTQFKWRILHKVSMGFDLNQNLCDVISEKWLNIPMKNAQYTSPLSLMDNLIIQNNYITLN